MIETVREASSAGGQGRTRTYFCNICSHEWTVALEPVGRFASIEQLVQRTGLRRDELATLADIGALNAFTHDRRSALWQVERAVRPAGELFQEGEHDRGEIAPLAPMNPDERLQADYAGMGLTIGPHPMALHRSTLALRGVLRASDLPQARDGRRVRVAGMVITRQRPGTAKGFVFLTLEDETGISNVIIRPDLFDRQRSEADPAAVPHRRRRAAAPGRRDVGAGRAAGGAGSAGGVHRRARLLLTDTILTASCATVSGAWSACIPSSDRSSPRDRMRCQAAAPCSISFFSRVPSG